MVIEERDKGKTDRNIERESFNVGIEINYINYMIVYCVL
jgi:hypothetical protein